MLRTTSVVVVLAGIACSVSAQEYRSVDGSGNNLSDPMMGAVGYSLLRESSGAHYTDGLGAMRAGPSPREVSNALSAQTAPLGNDRNLSSMFWQWGQFLDHDYALIDTGSESAPISVPAGDPFFDPTNSGTATIGFNRSAFTGGVSGPREHQSLITHYLDASNIYGSDTLRADTLRSFSGGRMATSAGNFMPFNTTGLDNANEGPIPDNQLFLGGDIRANEQLGLTSMHTLWVREHNQWADRLAAENPSWDDEKIFQMARKIVGAQEQKITYNDWLPEMLGTTLAPYSGYDENVNPSMSAAFTTAAYRIGHTLLNSQLLKIGPNGEDNGAFNLKDAFFNPALITTPGTLDDLFRGLAYQEANQIDTQVVDDIRNFLFGPPGAGGLDLISLNLQRGRDHGIADYNTMRQDFGLPAVNDFSDITSDASLAAALESVFGDVNNIDAWIGLMAEDHVPGAPIGESLLTIFSDQFTRLRDGDRFFYLNDAALLPYLSEIENTTLADIISRNTGAQLYGNVFVVPAPASIAIMGMGLVAIRRRR